MQCRTHAKKSGGHGKNQGKPRKGKRLGMKRYEGGRLYWSVIWLSAKFSLFFNIIRIRDAILCRYEIWRYFFHYPRLSPQWTHATQINRPCPQLEFVLVVIDTQKYCQKPWYILNVCQVYWNLPWWINSVKGSKAGLVSRYVDFNPSYPPN